MLAMHCPPGCTPATSRQPGPNLPDWHKYAWPLVSVLLPSIRAARDAAPAGKGLQPPRPPGPSTSTPAPRGALGEADGAELPRGKGWGSAGRGRSRQPPQKGYSCLFYKYIYIFCSKVLLPHVSAGGWCGAV